MLTAYSSLPITVVSNMSDCYVVTVIVSCHRCCDLSPLSRKIQPHFQIQTLNYISQYFLLYFSIAHCVQLQAFWHSVGPFLHVIFENNCVKTNKDRPILSLLSASQIFGMVSSFLQCKVCVDVRSDSLERRR